MQYKYDFCYLSSVISKCRTIRFKGGSIPTPKPVTPPASPPPPAPVQDTAQQVVDEQTDEKDKRRRAFGYAKTILTDKGAGLGANGQSVSTGTKSVLG